MFYAKKYGVPTILTRCSYSEDNSPVQSGLNPTPSQVFSSAQQGIPISGTSSAEMPLVEPQVSSFSLPAYFERRAELATVWEAEQSARRQVKRGVDTLISHGIGKITNSSDNGTT